MQSPSNLETPRASDLGADGSGPLGCAITSKLRFAVLLMRMLSVGYVLEVLWRIQNWWLDGARVTKDLQYYWGLDVSAMQAWQRLLAMGVDLIGLSFVIVAVVYCWRFMGTLQRRTGFTMNGMKFLLRCAQWALAAEVWSLVTRPLKSYLLTMHLSAQDQQWRWGLQSADIQTIILCLALFMFALMFSWAIEISNENREFV